LLIWLWPMLSAVISSK